ncbi:MAG: hypothetical protein P1U58_01115 [Verrucomicrobiales bacterium]|nr:hypothetical protein [Verrucomicrobiales bacterium]
MLGWKPVERKIETSLLIDEAVEKAKEIGFEISNENPGFTVLHRDGAWWATRTGSVESEGKDRNQVPLELGIAEADDGIYFQLRYGTFVAFDTGDLERFANEIVSIFTEAAHG